MGFTILWSIFVAVGGWLMYAAHHDLTSPGYIGSAGIAVMFLGLIGLVLFLVGATGLSVIWIF